MFRSRPAAQKLFALLFHISSVSGNKIIAAFAAREEHGEVAAREEHVEVVKSSAVTIGSKRQMTSMLR